MKRKLVFVVLGVLIGFLIVFGRSDKIDFPSPPAKGVLTQKAPPEIKAVKYETELHDPAKPHKPETYSTRVPRNLYSAEMTVHEEVQEYLHETLIPDEAKYFTVGFGVEELSGIPYDHMRYNFEEEIAEHPGEYTAASKLALYIPFLMKVIQQKPGYDSLEGLDADKAKEMLLHCLTTLEEFDREYPYYKSFVPWAKINESGGLEPLNDYIPALDNGQLTWALAALISGLKDIEGPLTKQIYYKAALILEKQNYEEFYDFGSDRLYGTLEIDPETKWWVDRNSYHLMDMYEGSMAVLWAVLHGGASEDAWFKLGAPTVDYVTMDGDVVTTIQGFRASFHEFWAVAYLPIMESKLGELYYNYFHIQADFAKKNSMPGFPTTAYDPRGDYRQMGVPDIAGHDVDRSDVSVLYGTALGVTIAPKTGSAWMRNLHAVEQLMTPLGALESIGYDGVSNVFSSDGKGMTLLASSGGIVSEIRQYLKTTLYKDTDMTLYDKLMELFDKKYDQILEQRGKPFYHPTQPIQMPGEFVFEEFYREKVPSISGSFDIIDNVAPSHRHGKNVNTPGSLELEDDVFPGDPIRFEYKISENADEENNWAFRGTYLGTEIGIQDAVELTLEIPVTEERVIYRIELKRDSALLAEVLVDSADEGELSEAGQWKTLTYSLKVSEEAQTKAFNYVAFSINKPAYEGELAEVFARNGEVHIQELVIST